MKNSWLTWTLVIFIRAPILLPFWLLYRIGKLAERAGTWLGARLPGLE